MQLYKLNKTVLCIKNNPSQFLSGLTSNTPEKPQNAFLNIHGRIIATFEQIKISDEEVWLIIEEKFIDCLLEHIDKYTKLSGVDVKPLQQYVYFDMEDKVNAQLDSQRLIPTSVTCIRIHC